MKFKKRKRKANTRTALPTETVITNDAQDLKEVLSLQKSRIHRGHRGVTANSLLKPKTDVSKAKDGSDASNNKQQSKNDDSISTGSSSTGGLRGSGAFAGAIGDASTVQKRKIDTIMNQYIENKVKATHQDNPEDLDQQNPDQKKRKSSESFDLPVKKEDEETVLGGVIAFGTGLAEVALPLSMKQAAIKEYEGHRYLKSQKSKPQKTSKELLTDNDVSDMIKEVMHRKTGVGETLRGASIAANYRKFRHDNWKRKKEIEMEDKVSRFKQGIKEGRFVDPKTYNPNKSTDEGVRDYIKKREKRNRDNSERTKDDLAAASFRKKMYRKM